MADDDLIAIVSVGMMTSVGLSAAETAASVRAATMRFAEMPWLDKAYEPFTAAFVIDEGLPELNDALRAQPGMTARQARMLRLATMPLLECLQPVRDAGEPIGLALALPEMQTTIPVDAAAFLEQLWQQTDGAFDLATSRCCETGRAGGLSAIGMAAGLVRDGQAPLALAGGVDTYLALHLLATLDLQQRIKSVKNLDGFVPGEGAGFLLLASQKGAANLGLEPMAVISALSEGFEDGHFESDKPYQGQGLADVFGSLFQQWDDQPPVQEVFSSMNGESYWGKEWGVSLLRNQARFAPRHRLHHPADCFGDTGAASGPLMAGLAAQGMARQYRGSPALVICSSDKGPRAALAITAP